MGVVLGKHVLYFALQPTAEAADQARALADDVRGRHGFKAKPLAADRLHVSLNFVGSFARPPGPVVDKAREAVEAVTARSFVVAFSRLGTWPAGDPPPLVLWGDEGVIGVEGLYTMIHKALVRPGMVQRRQVEITPHMTLLRDPAKAPETVIAPLRWRVREFVLIHAIHGEGRHEVVGRWALSD